MSWSSFESIRGRVTAISKHRIFVSSSQLSRFILFISRFASNLLSQALSLRRSKGPGRREVRLREPGRLAKVGV